MLWKALSKDEQAVFRTPILAALAGAPEMVCDTSTTSGMLSVLEAQPRTLSEAEEALYRPIYDRLVSPERIADHFGAGARAPSTPTSIKKALKDFNAFHREVCHFPDIFKLS